MDRRAYLIGVGGVVSISGCVSVDLGSDDGAEPDDDDVTASGNGDVNIEPSNGTEEPANQEPTDGGDGDDGSGELQGTGREDPQYVDVPYRDYSDEEADRVREEAEDIAYDDLFRDIESHQGDAVHFEGIVVQALEGQDHHTILVSLDAYGEQLMYGSWTGSRFLQNDRIEIWAEVIGTETYQMASGGQTTVPALTIADAELVE